MSRHSKNATTLGFFTAAERQGLSGIYGTKEQRLSQDSLRLFSECVLCLADARDPMACAKGHVACKECWYENILSQRKDKERNKRMAVDLKLNEEVLRLQKEEKELDERKRQFERTANGLGAASSRPANSGKTTTSKDATGPYSNMPAFWLPSQTPDATSAQSSEQAAASAKREIMCPGPGDEHPISTKRLAPVQFTIAKESKSKDKIPPTRSGTGKKTNYICPLCLHPLQNQHHPTLLTCSHVVCSGCNKKLIKPYKRCSLCDVKVKSVEIQTEGTVFASGGGRIAKKYTEAFQC